MSQATTQAPVRSADVIILDAPSQAGNPAQAPTPKPEQTTEQPSRGGRDPRDIPQSYMDLAIGVLSLLGVCVVSYALVRIFTRRGLPAGGSVALAPELDARLTRIEQAVDAMSIEVERISEGQRFTTKLLSERAGDAAALPGRESR
jgi:hypothetical protein